MINDSWLDRPLSVAAFRPGPPKGRCRERLPLRRGSEPGPDFHNGHPPGRRQTNSGVKYDPARRSGGPTPAGTGSGSFYREVARTADCAPEDVVAGDLVLYNNQPGTVDGEAGGR